MPSYLDLGLIAVILVSALLAMLRGFTREVLAIASWIAAAAAALYLYPYLLPYVKPHLSKEPWASIVSATAIFITSLIVVSIVTVNLSDAILDSKVGALDRSLGFLFGAARGFILCVVAFVFFSILSPADKQPAWVRQRENATAAPKRRGRHAGDVAARPPQQYPQIESGDADRRIGGRGRCCNRQGSAGGRFTGAATAAKGQRWKSTLIGARHLELQLAFGAVRII